MLLPRSCCMPACSRICSALATVLAAAFGRVGDWVDIRHLSFLFVLRPGVSPGASSLSCGRSDAPPLYVEAFMAGALVERDAPLNYDVQELGIRVAAFANLHLRNAKGSAPTQDLRQMDPAQLLSQ